MTFSTLLAWLRRASLLLRVRNVAAAAGAAAHSSAPGAVPAEESGNGGAAPISGVDNDSDGRRPLPPVLPWVLLLPPQRGVALTPPLLAVESVLPARLMPDSLSAEPCDADFSRSNCAAFNAARRSLHKLREDAHHDITVLKPG